MQHITDRLGVGLPELAGAKTESYNFSAELVLKIPDGETSDVWRSAARRGDHPP